MTDWLTRLEDLDEQATSGPWHYYIGIPDAELAAHLRNRSKEIATLVERVKSVDRAWSTHNSGHIEIEINKMREALHNLLREETCDS